jgi:hypothetical protein
VLLAAFASTLLLTSTNGVEARTAAIAAKTTNPAARIGLQGASGAMPGTRAGVPRSTLLAKALDRWIWIDSSSDPSLTSGQLIRFSDAGDGRIVATVYDDVGKPAKENPWNLAELSEVGGLPMISGYVDLPGGSPKSHEHSVLVWFTVDPAAPGSLQVDATLVHPPGGHPDHAQRMDRMAMDAAGQSLARALSAGGGATPASISARARGLSGLVGILWHNGTWHGSGD